MINPISFQYHTATYPYPRVNHLSTAWPVQPISPIRPVSERSPLFFKTTEATECQTCNDRKYIDRSNEGNVSFQTPTHISPEASYSAVEAHEQEHVSNAIAKGSEPGKEFVSAYVQLKMEVCPDCGKPYVAGGETITQIRYNTNNPYESNRKAAEEGILKGINFDAVA